MPSAITIAAHDLAALQFLATAPLSKQLRGASPPRGTESPIEAKEERKARMRALDLERLRAKVESGGADEEKVVALVGKLGEWARTPAGDAGAGAHPRHCRGCLALRR